MRLTLKKLITIGIVIKLITMDVYEDADYSITPKWPAARYQKGKK